MLFIALMLTWNLAATLALIWLWVAMREARNVAADVFDIHTKKLRELFGMKEAEFPKYASGVVPTPVAPVTDWTAHDAAVSATLAVGRHNGAYGVPMVDPETAPFFTESAPKD